MQEPVATILGPCRALAARPDLRLSDLVALAREIALTDAQIDALEQRDPGRPYGRRVLLAEPRLEVMVATWTPGVPCAPHDHGGSTGVVRVLRGRAHHQVWAAREGRLELLREHWPEAGELLACGTELLHSMASADPDTPLVTLHLYTDSIPHMLVYDVAAGETLVVDGGCGAWVPEAGSGLLLARLAGLLDRAGVSARWAPPSGSDPAGG